MKFVSCEGWTRGARGSYKGCGRKSAIHLLTYIQTHWYVAPFSCTGGDYWNQGEGQFVCPKCGATNRLFDRPEVEALKHSFGSVEDTYKRDY